MAIINNIIKLKQKKQDLSVLIQLNIKYNGTYIENKLYEIKEKPFT